VPRLRWLLMSLGRCSLCSSTYFLVDARLAEKRRRGPEVGFEDSKPVSGQRCGGDQTLGIADQVLCRPVIIAEDGASGGCRHYAEPLRM